MNEQTSHAGYSEDIVNAETLRQELLGYIHNAPTPQQAGPLNEAARQILRQASQVELLESRTDEPISIPTKSIVSLPGLHPEDWANPARSSKDARYIKRLARKSGDIDPITGLASVYIQPNGVVLTELLNNGTHATLASIKSRRPHIKLHGQVSVMQLHQDIVPLAHDK